MPALEKLYEVGRQQATRCGGFGAPETAGWAGRQKLGLGGGWQVLQYDLAAATASRATKKVGIGDPAPGIQTPTAGGNWTSQLGSWTREPAAVTCHRLRREPAK